jgi:hypothetical protein
MDAVVFIRASVRVTMLAVKKPAASSSMLLVNVSGRLAVGACKKARSASLMVSGWLEEGVVYRNADKSLKVGAWLDGASDA